MEIIVIVLILFLILLTEVLLYRKFGLYGVQYSVRLSCDEAYEGDEIEIIEEVTNRKWLPLPWLKSEISTSRWLEFSGTRANRAIDSRFVPSVFALRPNQKCTRVWRVKCLKRGVFSLWDTSIVTCDIFGLVTNSARIKVNEKIRVLPSPYAVDEATLSDRELFGNVIVKRFICEDPFIISGAREYSGFEPMSRIHWNGTTRTGKLMVFNNEYSTDNGVLIAMNMQRGGSSLLKPANISEIETYIKLTAFLLDTCIKKGLSSGFVTNSGGDNGMTLVPPDTSPAHITQILRLMAELEERCDMEFADMLGLPEMLGTRYTDLLIITSYVDDRILTAAYEQKRQGKNVVFYCNRDEEIPFPLIHTGILSHFYLLNDNEPEGKAATNE